MEAHLVAIDIATWPEDYIAEFLFDSWERFFVANHTIRVVINKPKSRKRSWLDTLKDIGPVLTGIATLILSIVSACYVHTIDKQKQESDAGKAAQEATAQQTKTLESISQDAITREIAAIKLAAYGKSALPTLRIILRGGGSTDPSVSKPMRDFAEEVAIRLMDVSDSETRSLLLEELRSLARADTEEPRFEAFETLQKLSNTSRGFSNSESALVDDLLVERFGSGNSPAEKSLRVANEACFLVPKCPYERCRTVLLDVPSIPAKQCVGAYRTILGAHPSQETCKMVLNDLNTVIAAPTSNADYRKSMIKELDWAKKGVCQ